MQREHHIRYHRQMILEGFGEAAQQKLLDAKVLVVGAGGLGCPALQYLAGAGVGRLGIVDGDLVAMDNLHRQTLFTTEDLHKPKAAVAGDRLRALNPDIRIDVFSFRLNPQNALDLLEPYDLIIDGTDNFSTRYLINDTCVLLGKPLVYGAVSQWEGQVGIFNCSTSDGEGPVNYRDLFPEPPKESEVRSCAEAGVIGALPGIIGSMQAAEAIKYITGTGKPLVHTLLTYNLTDHSVFELHMSKRRDSHMMMPLTPEALREMDYEFLCGTAKGDEINAELFDQLTGNGNPLVIDIREPHELPEVHAFPHIKIPFSVLESRLPQIREEEVIFFCQSGHRSLKAVHMLRGQGNPGQKVYSLQGGIVNWMQNHKMASHE